MLSVSSCFKRFLHNHSKLVDFVSASLIICLCLIILLPKVHDSFQTTPDQPTHNHNNLPHDQENTVGLVANLVNLADTLPSTVAANNHNHHHHHDHKLPVGEVIICIGFFVFYCIGLGLSKAGSLQENEPLLMAERKISTVCCSSTRCPSGQREILETSADNDSRYKSQSEEGFLDAGGEEDCVFALNRHHSHHTHIRHHEHQQVGQVNKSSKDYGSTSGNPAMKVTPELVKNKNMNNPNTVYVEEIQITRRSVDFDKTACLNWPPSIRYTLFGLLLSVILIVFDMNIQGLIETIKVFRAAATGALLYIAFFIVLPKDPAGCNSCIEEEVA